MLGPGLITGAADDDPSGISTYSVAGASTGFSMLWIALISTPMMAVVQGMCARIAHVSGMGLAAVMRRWLPPWAMYATAGLVVIANTINIGADIGGMAASMHLVAGVSTTVWAVGFGGLLILVQVFLSYKIIESYLKWLTLSLLAYVITAFIVHPPWPDVLRHTVIPQIRLDSAWITTLVAVLGTTISPYLFFWQAALVVENEKQLGRKTIAARRGATKTEIKIAHLDTNAGMMVSNAIFFFIVVTTASTLGAHGNTSIQTAQQAAEALRPLAGTYAELLFALGMVGTGLLAVPALAGSSAYVVAEGFRLRHGFDEKPRRAPHFYGVVIAGTVIGVVMILLQFNAIAALYWSAVINGVISVPLIAMTTLLANDKRLMGKWTNSRSANFWAIATTALMAAAAVAMFVYWGK